MASSAFEVRNDREARIGYANVEFRVNAEILLTFKTFRNIFRPF